MECPVVTATYPGADPQVIAETVATPIEERRVAEAASL